MRPVLAHARSPDDRIEPATHRRSIVNRKFPAQTLVELPHAIRALPEKIKPDDGCFDLPNAAMDGVRDLFDRAAPNKISDNDADRLRGQRLNPGDIGARNRRSFDRDRKNRELGRRDAKFGESAFSPQAVDRGGAAQQIAKICFHTSVS
jgi:hypothetical protein